MSKADNKELEEAEKTMWHWIGYEKKNKKKINKAEDLIEIQEIVLKELKRLQEENSKLERANKAYVNSIQSITPVLLEDYIAKDEIREKIEELNKNKDMISGGYAISILEELLEGK